MSLTILNWFENKTTRDRKICGSKIGKMFFQSDIPVIVLSGSCCGERQAGRRRLPSGEEGSLSYRL